jgi:putative transposase
VTEAVATIILTYRVRAQATRQQRRALESILEQQRQLYNAALEERIESYRKSAAQIVGQIRRDRADGLARSFNHATGAVHLCRRRDLKAYELAGLLDYERQVLTGEMRIARSVTEFDQSKSLTQIRADDPAFAAVQRRIQRATLIRLDRAYKAFFQRAKAGAGAASGFPKFKGRDYFDGFGFDAPQQIKFDGRRLRFAGLCGGLRLSKRDLRRLPEINSETWKGVHFKRTHAGWAVTLQIERPVRDTRAGCGKAAVGVDWGTSVLAALSTGQIEDNPRPREAAATELKRHERKVARAKRGSKRRLKARRRKQAVERAIANRRRNRMDKLSARLVTHYGFVAVEDLAVKNMMDAERPGETLPQSVKTRRNREALDAAPYLLRQMVAYKASRERCGFAAVDPKNTTQECSLCGGIHFKELTEALHVCTTPGPFYSMTLPRKVNAARVILKRALSPIANGGDDSAGRGRAGGAKASNGGTTLRRPRNTSPRQQAGADGSRSGTAGTPQLVHVRSAKDPRLRPGSS